MTEDKFADLKFDPRRIGEEISHATGGFRQAPGQDRIALVVVPAQDILGVELRTVRDFQFALAPASGRADAFGRESRPASRFISLLEKQHPRALFRSHESGHETAPPGADDDDIAIQVFHGTSNRHGREII